MVVKDPVEIGSLLYCKEGYRQGRPCLAGTRIPVNTIAGMHLQGLSPEQILDELPHLDLPRIYAALTYFLANRETVISEMVADVQEGDELARELSQPVEPT